MRANFFSLFAFSSALVVTGCVNVSTANVDSGTNIGSLKLMYVQQAQTDQRGVGTLIADKLRAKGVQATVGTDAPKARVDAVVSYKDVWVWDWSHYLLDLTIVMKDPKTEQVLASGNSRHGSLTRLTPTEMVSEVIDKIYSASGGSGVVSTTTPAAALTTQPQQQQSNVQKLQELKSLLDQGVITKSEYVQKRSSLLNQM